MSTLDLTRPASTRVLVARLAEQVVARDAGVSATRGSGRWLTGDGDRSIDGVVVGPGAGGRLDVELHLIAEWPVQPLPALAERLRWELTNEAAGAGLGERLGEIDVWVHDFRTSDEAAEESP